MSVCRRCGARFGCGMTDAAQLAPCWCALLPAALSVPIVPIVPIVPSATDVPNSAACWCPACLKQQIAVLEAEGAKSAS